MKAAYLVEKTVVSTEISRVAKMVGYLVDLRVGELEYLTVAEKADSMAALTGSSKVERKAALMVDS